VATGVWFQINSSGHCPPNLLAVLKYYAVSSKFYNTELASIFKKKKSKNPKRFSREFYYAF
jgi:hypothetical protein